MQNTKPQLHDEYGKQLFKLIFKDNFDDKPKREAFGQDGEIAGTFRIDGILKKEKIAIEIESRANKQVRGALVDLALHPLNNILLVLIKKYSNDYTPKQCDIILHTLAPGKKIKVVELLGAGDNQKIKEDKKEIKKAIKRLISI